MASSPSWLLYALGALVVVCAVAVVIQFTSKG